MPSGKTARPSITDNKDGTVTVHYAPSEKGLHEMDIRYDGNHIPGEPLGALGATGGTGWWLRKVDTTMPWLDSCGSSMHRGMECLCGVSLWGQWLVTLRLGCPHGSLTIVPCDSPGSPLQFYVDAINPRHVSAYGPGLSHGMVNKPCTFTIVTKDAGEGE